MAEQQNTPPQPLVEVLDAQGGILAVMPAAEAAKQKLRHRSVTVLLFDDQGRITLRKLPGPLAGKPRWDALVRSPVLAGEAVQDAATRALETEMGIRVERLRPLLELPPQPENNNEHLHVFSLTRAEALTTAAQDREGGDYSFSPEELDCLLRDFRELVAPRFILLAETMSLKGLWRRRP